MRAVMIVALLGGCAPEIVSGAYRCGPDASCPDGQACNGPDNTCVAPSSVEPFACEPAVQTEPDDTAASAFALGELDCLEVFSTDSCMVAGDSADWFQFAAPAGCGDVHAAARVRFPIAFQQLQLELWDLGSNTLVTADAECTVGSDEGGEELRCLEADLVTGSSYGLRVIPTGDGTCAGDCAYNRYTVRVQLTAAL